MGRPVVVINSLKEKSQFRSPIKSPSVDERCHLFQSWWLQQKAEEGGGEQGRLRPPSRLRQGLRDATAVEVTMSGSTVENAD
jgi:hypothetical protein